MGTGESGAGGVAEMWGFSGRGGAGGWEIGSFGGGVGGSYRDVEAGCWLWSVEVGRVFWPFAPLLGIVG